MKKYIPYIMICLIIVITIISILGINYSKKNNISLDEKMKNYCEQIFKNEEIGSNEVYVSLKSMKERYNLDISDFTNPKHNCSLENSMAKASKVNGKLTCSINLICENM